MALAYTRLGKINPKSHAEPQCDADESRPTIPVTTPVASAPRITDDIADAMHFLEGVLRDLTQLVTSQTENVALRPYVDERLMQVIKRMAELEQNQGADLGKLTAMVDGVKAAASDQATKIDEFARHVQNKFRTVIEQIEERTKAAAENRARLAEDMKTGNAELVRQMESGFKWVREQIELHYSKIGTLNDQFVIAVNSHDKLADVVENLKDRQQSLVKAHDINVNAIETCKRDVAFANNQHANNKTLISDLEGDHHKLAGETIEMEADLRQSLKVLSNQLAFLNVTVSDLVNQRRLARRPLWKRISSALLRR